MYHVPIIMTKDNNTTEYIVDNEEFDFRFNFISTPWGERSTKSKYGVVFLLCAIFVAIMALVANNIMIHFGSKGTHRTRLVNSEYQCQLVKMEDYKYVARIYLESTHELMCIGAVLSDKLVLANKACVKNGLVRVYVSSTSDPRCKKGFTISNIEQVSFEGIEVTELVLLSTYNSMSTCVKPISIGTNLQKTKLAYVIGRPSHDVRLLTRHPVMAEDRNCSCPGLKLYLKNTFNRFVCVKSLVHCPMLVGDLLVQNNYIFGLSTTSVYHLKRFSVACFSAVNHIQNLVKY